MQVQSSNQKEVGRRERLCKEAKTKTVQRTNFRANRIVNPRNKLKNAIVDAPKKQQLQESKF